MALHALMEKPGDGQMYVPPDKVQAYLDDGWRMIREAEKTAVGPYQPVAPEPLPAPSEAPVEAPEMQKPRKSKKG